MKQNLCLICGARRDLTQHHLTSRTLKKEFKNGMNAIVEEITLCQSCHELVEYEKQGMRWGKKLAKVKKKYYNKGFNDCMERGVETQAEDKKDNGNKVLREREDATGGKK